MKIEEIESAIPCETRSRVTQQLSPADSPRVVTQREVVDEGAEKVTTKSTNMERSDEGGRWINQRWRASIAPSEEWRARKPVGN